MESWTNVARCLRHGLTSKIPIVEYDLSLEKMSGGLGNRLPKAVEKLWGEVCAVRPFNGVGSGVAKDLLEVVT